MKVGDLSRIVDVAKQIIGEFNDGRAYWRGHGNADWRLQPHAFRRQTDDECAPMSHLQVRARTRSHTKTPEPDDYLAWLFLAQHDCLPTRLLDWTENPLVALYFAAAECEQEGYIWALQPGELNKCFGGGGFSGLVMIRDPRVIELAEPSFLFPLLVATT
jgi:hypothetical protein